MFIIKSLTICDGIFILFGKSQFAQFVIGPLAMRCIFLFFAGFPFTTDVDCALFRKSNSLDSDVTKLAALVHGYTFICLAHKVQTIHLPFYQFLVVCRQH